MSLFFARPARSQDVERPHFSFGVGHCPEPIAVEQEVLRLTPPDRHRLFEDGVRVESEDLDDGYRVTVSKDGVSVTKDYADPGRDCDGRARFAAVFVVLTVMPPELGQKPAEPEPPPPPPLPPPPPPIVEPPIAKPRELRAPLARVELDALAVWAPAVQGAPSIASWGGELRVVLGRDWLAGTLGVGYTPASSFTLGDLRASVTRMPASAGLRARAPLAGWELAVDVGALLTLERVEPTNLLVRRQATRVEGGVRTGARFGRELTRGLSAFAGAFTWIVPAPSELYALPAGKLGTMPYVWFGVNAGLELSL